MPSRGSYFFFYFIYLRERIARGYSQLSSLTVANKRKLYLWAREGDTQQYFIFNGALKEERKTPTRLVFTTKDLAVINISRCRVDTTIRRRIARDFFSFYFSSIFLWKKPGEVPGPPPPPPPTPPLNSELKQRRQRRQRERQKRQ